eukprot:1189838-Prorocentrum_minimum.AAC.3
MHNTKTSNFFFARGNGGLSRLHQSESSPNAGVDARGAGNSSSGGAPRGRGRVQPGAGVDARGAGGGAARAGVGAAAGAHPHGGGAAEGEGGAAGQAGPGEAPAGGQARAQEGEKDPLRPRARPDGVGDRADAEDVPGAAADAAGAAADAEQRGGASPARRDGGARGGGRAGPVPAGGAAGAGAAAVAPAAAGGGAHGPLRRRQGAGSPVAIYIKHITRTNSSGPVLYWGANDRKNHKSYI